jgi:hypothetical protein
MKFSLNQWENWNGIFFRNGGSISLFGFTGTIAALLQEIINIYPAINPPTLTAHQVTYS